MEQSIVDWIGDFKNKWIVEHIVKFEKEGKPGKIELHFGIDGNCTDCIPAPHNRRPKE